MNFRSFFGLVILMISGISWSGGSNVEAARQDLAKRLEVTLQQVTIVSLEEKEWPNAGLGCPLPGMNYAQVITSGSELILSVDGQPYFYHARTGRAFALCVKQPRKSLPYPAPAQMD